MQDMGVLGSSSSSKRKAYVLIRNDLDTDDMASRLKDLLQNILSHPRVKATDIQSPLVWFRGSTAYETTGAGRGHHVSGHGRGNGGRDGVGVLRNHHRRAGRRRHVGRISLTIALRRIVLLVGSSSRGLGGRREGRRGGSGNVVGHC